MFKLNAKFDGDLLLYSLSDFECDGHTVHMLSQQRLLPPLTSTVTSSLFAHAHSSPLSLDAGLQRCRAHCSRCINNGWAFSRQPSYTLHLMQYTYQGVFLHCSKQFLNSSILMPFTVPAIFLFHLFHIGKTFPSENFFHPGETKKIPLG